MGTRVADPTYRISQYQPNKLNIFNPNRKQSQPQQHTLVSQKSFEFGKGPLAGSVSCKNANNKHNIAYKYWSSANATSPVATNRAANAQKLTANHLQNSRQIVESRTSNDRTRPHTTGNNINQRHVINRKQQQAANQGKVTKKCLLRDWRQQAPHLFNFPLNSQGDLASLIQTAQSNQDSFVITSQRQLSNANMVSKEQQQSNQQLAAAKAATRQSAQFQSNMINLQLGDASKSITGLTSAAFTTAQGTQQPSSARATPSNAQTDSNVYQTQTQQVYE